MLNRKKEISKIFNVLNQIWNDISFFGIISCLHHHLNTKMVSSFILVHWSIQVSFLSVHKWKKKWFTSWIYHQFQLGIRSKAKPEKNRTNQPIGIMFESFCRNSFNFFSVPFIFIFIFCIWRQWYLRNEFNWSGSINIILHSIFSFIHSTIIYIYFWLQL